MDPREWTNRIFRIVSQYGLGGALAFPGLASGVPIEKAVRLSFGAFPDLASLLLLRFDANPNDAFSGPAINLGWRFCFFGTAGKQVPIGKGELPAWDPSQADVFNQWCAELWDHIELQPNEKPGPQVLNSRQRLYCVAPFQDDAGVIHNESVEVFRVKDALAKPFEGSRDWCAYRINPLPGNGLLQQGGGGSGPPGLP
jgi:hypothetical protein